MGGCQKFGLFLDPYYNTAPNIQGTPKGNIILPTTHIWSPESSCLIVAQYGTFPNQWDPTIDPQIL